MNLWLFLSPSHTLNTTSLDPLWNSNPFLPLSILPEANNTSSTKPSLKKKTISTRSEMEHSSIVAKRLWQVVRAVFYMLRMRGISKKKLMLDFHLFLDRSKLAGKSFIYHLTHHNHRNSTSRKYNPREVEFSCSNTPSYTSFHLPKRKANNHHHHRDNHYDPNNYFYNFDAKEIAKALEVLNGSDSPYAESPVWSIGKSPAQMTRHLRITDSPFPVIEEEGLDVDKEIDMEAEEFIRKFYEQLRSQQSVPATPVYKLPS